MANQRICSVDGCGKPHNAKGFCGAHGARMRRHGDPLKGRTKNGDPARFAQSLVTLDHDDNCLIWPFGKTTGRGILVVDGVDKYAHRYVCELINGPAPTEFHEAAHECGNGHIGCVNPRHLSWKTSKENQADRIRHGTECRGEKHVSSKITEEQVREIRSMIGEEPQTSIAKRYGIGQQTVSKIKNRELWGWLI